MRGKGGQQWDEDDFYDEEADDEPYEDWEDGYDDHVAGKAAKKVRRLLQQAARSLGWGAAAHSWECPRGGVRM